MRINKKLIQVIASLWILVFHLWMPVSGSQLELFFIRIAYVGVDLFFFLSAYSLADKNIPYAELLKNRFGNIYCKYVVFAVIAMLYQGFGIVRLIKILTFAELFSRGGGSFLWFIPAIMLLYLIYPFYCRWNAKHKGIIVLVLWLVISIVLEHVFGYKKIFIFTNRIPVILAGHYFKTHQVKAWQGLAGIPAGLLLLNLLGNTKKLNVPFYEFYFVLGIVLTIGIVSLSTYVKETEIMRILGSATIEIYAIQMIFGVAILNLFYKLTGNKLVTNLLTICAVWLISLICSYVAYFISKKTGRKTDDEKSEESGES